MVVNLLVSGRVPTLMGLVMLGVLYRTPRGAQQEGGMPNWRLRRDDNYQFLYAELLELADRQR